MTRPRHSPPSPPHHTTDLVRLFGDKADGGADDAPPQRLAKRIAAAGLCSRRDAEKWIKAGRIAINGTQQISPACVVAAADTITVDGAPLPKADPPRCWRYYKPRGLVVSHRDEKGRDSIFDSLPTDMPRVVSIGRLDMDSEGLILLTTSGGLARHLELPATGWSRKYRVRVHGRVESAALDRLAGGITIDGIRYRGIKASLERQNASNAWLTMILTEGKNREIRRIIEHLGWRVSRLIRVSYGPFSLMTLKEGEVQEIRPAVLRDQLGVPREAQAKAQTKGVGRGKTAKGGRPSAKGGRPSAKGTGAKSGKKTGKGKGSGKGSGTTSAKGGRPSAKGKRHANHQRDKKRDTSHRP